MMKEKRSWNKLRRLCHDHVISGVQRESIKQITFYNIHLELQ